MIGQEDAADALAAVSRTRRRAFELAGYAQAGDMLIAWGLVWLICNLATYYALPYARMAWPAGIVIATGWSIVRGRRGVSGASDWRLYATIGTAFGLGVLLSLIAGIDSAGQGNALISSLVAASYIAAGIWVGHRFAWIGVALAGFIVAGWFFDRAHLELWLGIGGGGALIVTGFWLRRA